MIAIETTNSLEYLGVKYPVGSILQLDGETANGLIMRDLAKKAEVPDENASNIGELK